MWPYKKDTPSDAMCPFRFISCYGASCSPLYGVGRGWGGVLNLASAALDTDAKRADDAAKERHAVIQAEAVNGDKANEGTAAAQGHDSQASIDEDAR